jgi:hypothetical protein
MMKLFDYETYEDYGREWLLQILTIPKKFAFLDITVQWDDYGVDDILPLLAMSIGSHRLFAFCFRWGRFEIQCDIMDTRPRDLEWYRGTYDE